MNTPQLADSLRAAVLQAAIKGELTERSSENARDLLLRIQNEKQALQAKGSLKKTKAPTPVTADEVPFDIPENWVWVRLGEIGQIISGGTPKTTHSEYWKNGDIPWITPADMRSLNSRYIERGARNITKLGLKSSSAQLLPKGSVLFSSRAPIGYVAIARNEMTTNQGFKSVAPFKTEMSEYLYFVLLALKSEIEKLGTGTTFKEVSGTTVANVAIPLPPLAEQQAIVEKLTRLLAEIDRLKAEEQSLASLQKAYPQTLRASVLAAAVRGDLNERSQEHARDLLLRIQNEKQALQAKGSLKKTKAPAPVTADEVPFDIPENWVWVRLGEIGETNIGLTYDKKDISDKGTIILRSGNIQNDKIDLSDVVKINADIPQNKMCQKGDILICARNGSKSLVGKSAIINEEGFSFGAFMAIFRSPFNPYIFYYLQSPLFRSAFDGVGTTTINQITQDNLRNRLIPLPPLSEQQVIVEKLNRLLAEIDALENA